ncbi:hypothetical protein GGS20DRAFT_12203 [Poronia punctata]|nr:hypothetical protein GGS20DRAFT_12203 [Poronia punctata]
MYMLYIILVLRVQHSGRANLERCLPDTLPGEKYLQRTYLLLTTYLPRCLPFTCHLRAPKHMSTRVHTSPLIPQERRQVVPAVALHSRQPVASFRTLALSFNRPDTYFASYPRFIGLSQRYRDNQPRGDSSRNPNPSLHLGVTSPSGEGCLDLAAHADSIPWHPRRGDRPGPKDEKRELLLLRTSLPLRCLTSLLIDGCFFSRLVPKRNEQWQGIRPVSCTSWCKKIVVGLPWRNWARNKFTSKLHESRVYGSALSGLESFWTCCEISLDTTGLG